MTVASTSTRDGEWVGLAERAGGLFARYGLVIVIAWIGAMKFTQFEAEGIQPLVANSPAMAWLYDVFSVRTLSALLGVVEEVRFSSVARTDFHPVLGENDASYRQRLRFFRRWVLPLVHNRQTVQALLTPGI